MVDREFDVMMGDEIEESEDGESVASEEFNNMMNLYQNEFKGKGQGYSNRLPKCVNTLLGEANKMYLEKNFDQAIEKCCEAIKVYPENPEPYHLLSVIYEEKGDKRRAVDFLFMETQSNYKSDINSWCKLADSYYKLESYKYAGYCYGRALKCEKNNVTLLFNKAQCYDKLKDARGAIKYYEKIYTLVNGHKEVLMKLGKLYSKVEQQQKAIILMIDYLSKNVNDVDYDISNVVCELLMSRGKYKECCIFIEMLALNPYGLESIQSISLFYKNISTSLEDDNNNIDIIDKIFKECQSSVVGKLMDDDIKIMKHEIPVEMLVKYSYSILKIYTDNRMIDISRDILSYCETLDADEYFDVFIDVIDLYCEYNYIEDAIRICEKIYNNDSIEDKSLILMRMGYLYGKMNDREKEIDAYKRSLDINPNNKKARYMLSEIYETEGKYSDAYRILSNRSVHNDMVHDDNSMHYHSEGEDMIYLSDDDDMIGKRKTNDGRESSMRMDSNVNKNKKVDRLIKDIKEEDSLNIKTRRRMMNIVDLNENFFINIQQKIDDIMIKYDLDILLLNFKQLELRMKSSDSSSDTIYVDYKCIKKAVRLEQQKINLRDNIYKLLLNESKGKIRSAFEDISNEDVDMKRELISLFIFKRKKKDDNSRIDSIYKDSKNKSRVAKKLSQKVISKMKTIPDYIGGIQRFIDIVSISLKHMYINKKYMILSNICEILYKISKSFELHPSFQSLYYFYGFLSNCRIDNYEKAYIYFRVISKYLIRGKYQSKDTALYRCMTDMFKDYNIHDINNICICMINQLFNMFNHNTNNSNDAHHNFFQKLQKQYENNKEIEYYMNLLSCNNYIMSGSYQSAKECLVKYKDKDNDRLYNFLLGFINLVDSTNRNNENKIESIHTAFDYIERYKVLSPDRLCEVYYNMGRSFTHINMHQSAISMYNKCIDMIDNNRHNGIRDADNIYYECKYNILVWNYILNNTTMSNMCIRYMYNDI